MSIKMHARDDRFEILLSNETWEFKDIKEWQKAYTMLLKLKSKYGSKKTDDEEKDGGAS